MTHRYLQRWFAGGVRLSSCFVLAITALPTMAQEKSPLFYSVTMEQLEYRLGDEADVAAWDGDALVGTDELKLRLQSKGEYDRDASGFETLENQFYSSAPYRTSSTPSSGFASTRRRGPTARTVCSVFRDSHRSGSKWMRISS